MQVDEVVTPGGRRVAAWLPAGSGLPGLERRSAKFVEGLARVGDVLDADGALPRATKLLFAAAVCAVKRDVQLVGHHVAAAAAAGLPREHAEGAVVGLLISRGVEPHRLLAEAVERTYGPPEGEPGAPGDADVPGAYAYFEGYFGFVPDYVELLGERAGPALEGYFLMRQAALAETPLPPRDMELLLCAVNAGEYQARFVAIHARGARTAGATEEQLVEAALTAMPFAGVASWLPAAQGILESREPA